MISKSQPELIAHFAVLADSEKVYQRIREKMAQKLVVDVRITKSLITE